MGVFKRYWDRYKHNRKKRELLIQMFDDSEVIVKNYLEDEYVNWRDEIEGVRDFLEEVKTKKIESLEK